MNEKYTVLDLFSGIGGFSLGLERTEGFETIGFCEIDKKCHYVLKKHWPKVPIYSDIKLLSGIKADLICGGFPCQPFSSASRGRKVAEDLWPFMLDVIVNAMPSFIIAENVSDAPIDKARLDLEKLGYKCEIRNITAAQAGADHKRSRWWLIAYANNKSELSCSLDAEVAKLPELCKGLWAAENYSRTIRVSDGVSNRMDRIKQLGNSVVPQIPEVIGKAILAL